MRAAIKLVVPLAMAAGCVASPASAQTAWDGVVTGRVSQIDATDGNNLGFRVYLDGAPACGTGTPGWAYLNQSFDNYQVVAALVMTAWTTNRRVTLFSIRDTNGWCRIGYVQALG